MVLLSTVLAAFYSAYELLPPDLSYIEIFLSNTETLVVPRLVLVCVCSEVFDRFIVAS